MTEVRLSQAVTDQSPHFPDWLSTAIPTWPQIAEAHASYIRIPPWLLLTDTYVLVIDTGSATNRVFSCFHQGPVTKRAILRHADVHASEPYEVFTFGDLNLCKRGNRDCLGREDLSNCCGGVKLLNGIRSVIAVLEERVHPKEGPRTWAVDTVDVLGT